MVSIPISKEMRVEIEKAIYEMLLKKVGRLIIIDWELMDLVLNAELRVYLEIKTELEKK